VACRLGLEHFVESILTAAESVRGAGREENLAEAEDRCVSIIEGAFRSANTSVYEFGHKLAAGGRMAASLVGLFIRDRVIAAGRAGNVSAFLIRHGEVCPFFADAEQGEKTTGFVGENSVVTVELSSIELQAYDRIIALPSVLTAEQRSILAGYAVRPRFENRDGSSDGAELLPLVQSLYPQTAQVAFALQAQVGPEVIYLTQVAGGSGRPAQKLTDV